jgi:hypothetical protein
VGEKGNANKVLLVGLWPRRVGGGRGSRAGADGKVLLESPTCELEDNIKKTIKELE